MTEGRRAKARWLVVSVLAAITLAWIAFWAERLEGAGAVWGAWGVGILLTAVAIASRGKPLPPANRRTLGVGLVTAGTALLAASATLRADPSHALLLWEQATAAMLLPTASATLLGGVWLAWPPSGPTAQPPCCAACGALATKEYCTVCGARLL